ncbi:conserved hypothetical protein [Neospora caninum Liverpool]|nr:conserved hypothetical protein [Neospora caninum Liverpool]CBZ51662.1 conserved hypothetical protein [Neospora caninum Liverpool]|eukprot:XP_003881695.1 conserved hypothetical protein [Neospora caninum Liverpool]
MPVFSKRETAINKSAPPSGASKSDEADSRPPSPQELLMALAALAWLTLQQGEAAFLGDEATAGAESLESFQRRLDQLLKRLLALERYTASAAAAAPRPRSEGLAPRPKEATGTRGVEPPETERGERDGVDGEAEKLGAANIKGAQKETGKAVRRPSDAKEKNVALIGGPVSVYVEYVLFLLPLWERRKQLVERLKSFRVQGGKGGETGAVAVLCDLRALLRMLQDLQEADRLRRLFVTYLGMVSHATAGLSGDLEAPEAAETPASDNTQQRGVTKTRRNLEEIRGGGDNRGDEGGKDAEDFNSDILGEIRRIVGGGRHLLRQWEEEATKVAKRVPELGQKGEEAKSRGRRGRSSGQSGEENTQCVPLSFHALLQPSPPLSPYQLRHIAQDLLALGVSTPQVEREIESLRPFTHPSSGFASAFEGKESQKLAGPHSECPADMPSWRVMGEKAQTPVSEDSGAVHSSSASFSVLPSLDGEADDIDDALRVSPASLWRSTAVNLAPPSVRAEERELQFTLLRSYAREGRWREALKKLSLLLRLFVLENQQRDTRENPHSAQELPQRKPERAPREPTANQKSWERTVYGAAAIVAESCAEKEQYVAAAQSLAVLPVSLDPPPPDLLLPSSSSLSPFTSSLLPLSPTPLLPLSLSLAHALRQRLRDLRLCTTSSRASPSSSPSAQVSRSSPLSGSSGTPDGGAEETPGSVPAEGEARQGDSGSEMEVLGPPTACSPQHARQAKTLLDALSFLLLRLRWWIACAKKRGPPADGAGSRRPVPEDADADGGAERRDDAEDADASARESAAKARRAVDKQSAGSDGGSSTGTEDPNRSGSSSGAVEAFLRDGEKALASLEGFLSTAQAQLARLPQAPPGLQSEGTAGHGPAGHLVSGEAEKQEGLSEATDLDAAVARLGRFLEKAGEQETETSFGTSSSGQSCRSLLRTLRQTQDTDQLPGLVHALLQKNEGTDEARSTGKVNGRLTPLQAQFAILEALRLLYEGDDDADGEGDARGDGDERHEMAGHATRRRKAAVEALDDLLLVLLPNYVISASPSLATKTSPLHVGRLRPDVQTTLGFASVAMSLASLGDFPRLRRFLASLPRLPFDLSHLLAPPAHPVPPAGPAAPGLSLHLFPALTALLTLLLRVAEAAKTREGLESRPCETCLAFACSLVRDTPELLNLPTHLRAYLPSSLAFFLAHARHLKAGSSQMSEGSSPALAATLSAVAELVRKEPERLKDEIEEAMEKGRREAVFAKTLELVAAVRWQTRNLLEQLANAKRTERERDQRPDERYVGRVLARERRRIVTVYGQLLRAFQNDGSYPLFLSELLLSELRICDLKGQRRHLQSPSPAASSPSPGLSPLSPGSSSLSPGSSSPSFLSRAYVAALRSFSAFTSAADNFATLAQGSRKGTLAAEGSAQAAMEILDLMEDTGVDLHATAFSAALKANSKRASPSFFPPFFFQRASSPLLDALRLIRRMTAARACLPDTRCFNYALAAAARQTYLPASLQPGAARAPGACAENGDSEETAEDAGGGTAVGRGDAGAAAAEWLLREMGRAGAQVKPNAVTLTTALEAFKKAGVPPSPLLQSLLPDDPALAVAALRLLSGESSSLSSSSRCDSKPNKNATGQEKGDAQLSSLARNSTKVRVVDTPLLNALLHCQAVHGDVETAEKLFFSHLKSLQMFHLGQNAFDAHAAAVGRPDEASFQALLFAANKAANPEKAEQFLRLQILYRLAPRIQQWNEVLKAYTARLRALAERRAFPCQPHRKNRDLFDLVRIHAPGGERPKADEEEIDTAGRNGARSAAEELCESIDRLREIRATLKTDGPSPDVRTFLLLNRALSAAAAAVEVALGDRSAKECGDQTRGDECRSGGGQGLGCREPNASQSPSSSVSPSVLLAKIADTAHSVAQDYSRFLSLGSEPSAAPVADSPSPLSPAAPPELARFKPWVFGEAMRCAALAGRPADAVLLFLDELLPQREKVVEQRERENTDAACARAERAADPGVKAANAGTGKAVGASPEPTGKDFASEAEETGQGGFAGDENGGALRSRENASEDRCLRLLPLPVSIGQLLIEGLEGVAKERLGLVQVNAKKNREKEQVLKELGVPAWEKTRKEIDREETIQRLTALMQRGLTALRREWPRLAPNLEETLWGFEETLEADGPQMVGQAEEIGGKPNGSEREATGMGQVLTLLGAKGESGIRRKRAETGEKARSDRILLSRLPKGLFSEAAECQRRDTKSDTWERNALVSTAKPTREDLGCPGASRDVDGGIPVETARLWKEKNVCLSPGLAMKRELLHQLRKATTFEEACSAVSRLYRLRIHQPGLAFGPGDEAVVFKCLVRQAPRPVEALRVFGDLQEPLDSADPSQSPECLLHSCPSSSAPDVSPSSSSSSYSSSSDSSASSSSASSSAGSPKSTPALLPLGLLQEAFLSALRQSRAGEGDRLVEVIPFFVEAPYPPQALLSPSLTLEALNIVGGPRSGGTGGVNPAREAARKREIQAIFAFLQKCKQAVHSTGDDLGAPGGRRVRREELEDAGIKALGERGGWREAVALLHERLTSSPASPPPRAWWAAAQLAAERAKQPEVSRILKRLTRFKFAVADATQPPTLLAKVQQVLAEDLEDEEARRREKQLLETARRREAGDEIAYAVEGKETQTHAATGNRLRRRGKVTERVEEKDEETDEEDALIEGGVKSPFGEEVARYSVIYKLENLLNMPEEEPDTDLYYGKKKAVKRAKPRKGDARRS